MSRRRAASPLPPFGTDYDNEQVDTLGVGGSASRSRSRAPPGGASSFSFGSDQVPPMPSSPIRSRSRAGSEWNGSGGMAGALGSASPSVHDETPVGGRRNRSASRGLGLGLGSGSPFGTSADAPPVPRVTRTPSPPIRPAASAETYARPSTPDRRPVSPLPAASLSPTSASYPIARAYEASSQSNAALRRDLDALGGVSVAPTDVSASMFQDPDMFKKVEAKLRDLKAKLATANARADKLGAQAAALEAQVGKLEQEKHKLAIDAHQAQVKAQHLDESLANERRERQAERTEFAAEKALLAQRMRGGDTQRGAAERELEALRAERARITAERDEYRQETHTLTTNLSLAQRQLKELARRLELAQQQAERKTMDFNDAETRRMDLEAKLHRLAGSTRSITSTNDELQEELRYLQSMVHEERSRRIAAETAAEEERKKRVMLELSME
ncbi:hypothetical protein H9P43_007562 [Blastocladiella emersonii ATCC 22665]|nr:hypothetical protein H9P43_007562 [Blastocladiella emersonii ATCC 22665]